MIDRPNAVIAEQGGKNSFQHFAVGEHVRHAARHAKIVFEYRKRAVRYPNQVGTADTDVNIAGNIRAAHLPAKMLAAVNKFPRHNAFGKNPSLVINIPQKKIQRRQPLRQSLFDARPFARWNNAGQKIIWKNPFSALFASVNRESDSFVEKRQVGGLLNFAQFFRSKSKQRLLQSAVMLPRHTRSSEHLVVCVIHLVVHERQRCVRSDWYRRGCHRSSCNPAVESDFPGRTREHTAAHEPRRRRGLRYGATNLKRHYSPVQSKKWMQRSCISAVRQVLDSGEGVRNPRRKISIDMASTRHGIQIQRSSLSNTAKPFPLKTRERDTGDTTIGRKGKKQRVWSNDENN